MAYIRKTVDHCRATGKTEGKEMNIKEALKIIREEDYKLADYIENNGRTFSDLQLILYAQSILEKQKRNEKVLTK